MTPDRVIHSKAANYLYWLKNFNAKQKALEKATAELSNADRKLKESSDDLSNQRGTVAFSRAFCLASYPKSTSSARDT